jgi:membrane-associated protease RseP (regulator of RpoE activity)
VGVLPGADRRMRDEYLVVGAHFDHLGRGGPGSLASEPGIHNGADDNASGVAAMLATAERLAVGPRPRRSVVFVAFTGEESGLLGSARWVDNPTVPLEGVAAMINLDMVGRLRENGLVVYGSGTAEEWDEILPAALDSAGIDDVSHVPDGYGSSDQTSFYVRDVPVLHLFTNTHADYHRPSDDWDRIDAGGLERVSALVTGIARRLAGTSRVAATDLTPSPTEANPHGAGISAGPDRPSESSGRGYGPFLGTIPDMTPSDHGVRLTGVREGSPADEAGIRGGDVVVRFGEREITDLYAYTYALRDHQPGDTVRIVVERDGERVSVTAVLGERR